jgi:hypothetical protein
MKRFHSLLRWDGRVITVDLEQVDIGRAQADQGSVDGFEDYCTEEACVSIC